MPDPPADVACPCGRGVALADCCGRYLADDGAVGAPTAEALMRSRFSAFALGDEAYLRRTWHPSTRPRRVRVDPAVRWVRLEVSATTAGGMLDDDGSVTFAAHHERGGVPGLLRETSTFARVDGRWLYVGPT